MLNRRLRFATSELRRIYGSKRKSSALISIGYVSEYSKAGCLYMYGKHDLEHVSDCETRIAV
jgi:hypothetical protein